MKINQCKVLDNGIYELIASDGGVWYPAKKVAAALGYKNTRDVTNKYVSDDNTIILKSSNLNISNYSINTNRGEKFINKNGLIQLITYNNKISREQKHQFINNMDLEGVIDFNTNLEAQFISNLCEILDSSGINNIREYVVERYRIDVYLPDLKLAIEYDDKGHNNKNRASNDYNRQVFLSDKLKCEFLRLSYKNSNNENIGLVLKKIMELK